MMQRNYEHNDIQAKQFQHADWLRANQLIPNSVETGLKLCAKSKVEIKLHLYC